MALTGVVSSSAPWLRKLARARVPLGFFCGLFVLWMARPTAATLGIGLPVALLGEGLRVWAAEHLEKSREVTQSGPYRWMRHPLYVGSSVMGVGLSIACGSVWVAVLVLTYLAVTIGAAVRTEETFLRERFGRDYDAWRSGALTGAAHRRFSVERAMRNKEYRALIGVLVTMALLVAKALFLPGT